MMNWTTDSMPRFVDGKEATNLDHDSLNSWRVEASETSVCWTLLDGWKDVDSDLISLGMISYFPI
jgi:hypothetical protein